MKYDYSKVKLGTWEHLVAWAFQVVEGGCEKYPLQGALERVRAEAQVKTRAEYDQEIGDFLRELLVPTILSDVCLMPKDSQRLRALVNASRNAPEE